MTDESRVNAQVCEAPQRPEVYAGAGFLVLCSCLASWLSAVMKVLMKLVTVFTGEPPVFGCPAITRDVWPDSC